MKQILIVFIVLFISASAFAIYSMKTTGFFDNFDSGDIFENETTSITPSINNVEVPSSGIIPSISQDTFEKKVLNSKTFTIVEFGAEWCPPCYELAPTLEEIAKENSQIAIYSVNVDNEDNLTSRYRIQYLPTILFFKNGVEVERKVGALPKENLEAIIEKNS